MPRTSYPHRLCPPSERYPTWQATAGGPLVYLGWGKRDFARESIAMHSNPGWTYWILLEGSVELGTPRERKIYHAGQGFLCGPASPFGFPGRKAEVCQILAWIWKEPPFNDADLPGDLHRPLVFSQDQLRLLGVLHEQSRTETIEDAGRRVEALGHIRGLLDVIFQRAGNRPDRERDRVRTARQWMLNHLNKTAPAAALARFLNVSPMTLHRLFVKELGESPGAHFQRLKMEHSRRLLSLGNYSVKRVACELGYHYAQDFSRAYKTHFGESPTASLE